MSFRFLKGKVFARKNKEQGEKHHRLLDEEDEDLKKCDLCENMQLKLKKCENCNKPLLCNSCLEIEKLCINCDIEYRYFVQSLQRAKEANDLKKYKELL